MTIYRAASLGTYDVSAHLHLVSRGWLNYLHVWNTPTQ